MLNIFESMEKQVAEKSPKETILENEIDRLLKVSLTSEIQDCVLLSVEKQKNELLKDELEKSSTTRSQNQKEVDELIENVNQKTYTYADVRAQNQDLLMTISELKNMLRTIKKGKNVNTKFDEFKTLGKLVCVTPFNKTLANKAKNVSNTKVPSDRLKPITSQSTPKIEQSRQNNENVIARGMYRITKLETQTPDSKTNIHVSNSTCVESSNSVRRPKSKGTKSKNRVLKNTNAKSSTALVRKMSRSVSIDSNKCETKNSTLCHANKSVLNTKNVTAVNDGSNIVCVSCGKDVFLLSHEKCVARYALSRNSNVKRALFTTPVAAKSKNLGATSVVAKSRLSVANTPKATNKVFSASSLSHDSSQSKTLSNYMKNKIATSRKWQRWFEYQQSFNWSPKSKTAQSLPSETKSRIRVRSTSNTPVTTQKWVAKLSTLPSAFISCDAVCFGNDHFTAITGYGDYVQGNLTICHNLEVDDLLTGSRDSEFRVCLMSRATSTKYWLWHRRLSNLNFGTINQLTSKDLVDGLLKFKYNKDHLCLACEQGKIKKASLPPKLVTSTESKLELLHMDLCGPIRVASINGKKYILVIIDDYSRYTWVNFLRTKDEAPDMIIDFVNQNRSIVHTRYNKTPYELIRGRKPNIQYFHVFGSLCYPTNDHDDLLKMKPKADIGIFIGYSESSRELDGNTIMHSFELLEFKEAESSLNYQDPSNMYEFHQQHRYTNKWTKSHPIELVIGDHSKPVQTRNRLRTDAEMDVKTAFLNDPLKEEVFIHQSPHGIFINQSQYTMELLRKHEMEKCNTVTTPMATAKIDADLQGTPTDQTKYHSMIGELMYLTASRPDIAFSTFVCARYQAHPTEKHLKEVKRIFRYLRQSINKGLWYSKDPRFELIAYSDADLAGCLNDYKSTAGGLQFLGDKPVRWSSKKQDCTIMSTTEAEYVSLSTCCT
ncbi:retrovirus-related pol polyprotein from transposon TNT 1-94 [Tanacetum coccineum]